MQCRWDCEAIMQQHQVHLEKHSQGRQEWLLLHGSTRYNYQLRCSQVQGLSSLVAAGFLSDAQRSSRWLSGCLLEAREAHLVPETSLLALHSWSIRLRAQMQKIGKKKKSLMLLSAPRFCYYILILGCRVCYYC